jgi:vancomycin resistance protein VanJ
MRTSDFPEEGARGSEFGAWVAAGLLLLFVALPYLLVGSLVELELVVAQPLLRLVLLLAALILVVLALRRSAFRLLPLPGLALLFLLWETGNSIGLSPFADPAPENALEIYSQNIGSQPPAAFAAWLAEHPVDLLLLQEVYSGHRAAWARLADELGYRMLFQPLREDAGIGGLILSRLPLTRLAPVSAPTWGRKTRYFARARIEYRGQPIEIYTVHLESLPLVQGTRVLFGSSRLRRAQAELLARAIAATSVPIIVAGDLNAAPLYYSTRPLRRRLTDAWTEAGLGMGSTYPAALPLARIDALLQRGLRTVTAAVVRLSDSDHRGLHATLMLEE